MVYADTTYRPRRNTHIHTCMYITDATINPFDRRGESARALRAPVPRQPGESAKICLLYRRRYIGRIVGRIGGDKAVSNKSRTSA
jgi:hypothetical protein